MTNEQLDELERLEKAATNANWVSPKAKKDGTCQVYATHNGPLRCCVPVANTTKHDGDFIASLRNACPALLSLARIGLAAVEHRRLSRTREAGDKEMYDSMYAERRLADAYLTRKDDE